jgi:hypothetical protein
MGNMDEAKTENEQALIIELARRLANERRLINEVERRLVRLATEPRLQEGRGAITQERARRAKEYYLVVLSSEERWRLYREGRADAYQTGVRSEDSSGMGSLDWHCTDIAEAFSILAKLWTVATWAELSMSAHPAQAEGVLSFGELIACRPSSGEVATSEAEEPAA